MTGREHGPSESFVIKNDAALADVFSVWHEDRGVERLEMRGNLSDCLSFKTRAGAYPEVRRRDEEEEFERRAEYRCEERRDALDAAASNLELEPPDA